MAEFLFIGEKRSKKAIDKGWTWLTCQKERARLCAKQLFTALEKAGVDPKKQEFQNLWTDDDLINFGTLVYARLQLTKGVRIVGLGQRVNEELTQLEIDHTEIVHPAARGAWRKQETYNKHIRQKLCKD